MYPPYPTIYRSLSYPYLSSSMNIFNPLSCPSNRSRTMLTTASRRSLPAGARSVIVGGVNGTVNSSTTKWYLLKNVQLVSLTIMKCLGCSPWYGGILTSNVMCIKTTGGTSTCNGDSGGSLVLADGSNTLIGATSFGIVVGWPGVFTRIASYLDWFENNTGVANHGY